MNLFKWFKRPEPSRAQQRLAQPEELQRVGIPGLELVIAEYRERVRLRLPY